MELKTRYQYTYFIHTFLINQNRYNRYIARLLKDARFNLKIFQKEKDLEIYTYFLPRMRNFLFKTFEYNKAKLDKLEELSNDDISKSKVKDSLESYIDKVIFIIYKEKL